MRLLLSRLRSYFIFIPLIYFFTFVLGMLSLICSIADNAGRVQHNLARLWAWMILETCLTPVIVFGLERVTHTKTQVFAVNHVSAMDVPVLYSMLPVQFRIVANGNLFDYPFMGWHLRRSGQIPIDRTSMPSSVRSFVKAIKDLNGAMNVLIFPEGKRSRDGRLGRFFKGAFYLAVKAQVPVIPIAIVGTYAMLPIDTYHIVPQALELRIGEPVPTVGLTMHDLESLSIKVRQSIERLQYNRPGQDR
jgi:1-acyl-sn-glycerol-3-phosphate acyltransferase